MPSPAEKLWRGIPQVSPSNPSHVLESDKARNANAKALNLEFTDEVPLGNCVTLKYFIAERVAETSPKS